MEESIAMPLNLDIYADIDRKTEIHCAKVYLAQSRHFTGRARGFSFVLMEWSANCRRRAAVKADVFGQMELFGNEGIRRAA